MIDPDKAVDAMKADLITVNAARKLVGQPPLAGGDRYWSQMPKLLLGPEDFHRLFDAAMARHVDAPTLVMLNSGDIVEAEPSLPSGTEMVATWTDDRGQLDVGVVYDLPRWWHPVQRIRKRRAVRQFLVANS